jgi:hypothetical protein
MRACAPIALAAAVLLLGCGEEPPETDDEAVRQTIADYVDGIQSRDGDKACSQLTEEAQQYVSNYAAGPDPSAEPPSCERILGSFSKENALEDGLDRLRIDSVRIRGDRATVSTSQPAGELGLVKRDGDWYLSDPSTGQ